MTVTKEDFLALQNRNGTRMTKEVHEQKVLAKGVGLEMEGLTQEPRWKLYLDAVNLILEKNTAQKQDLERRLLSEEDLKVRRDYQKASGVVEGLTSAIGCAKVLIQQGVLAGKTLEEN